MNTQVKANPAAMQPTVRLNLYELLEVLWRRVWVIILAAMLFAAAAFGYTYMFVQPTYSASALLYVNNSKVSIGSTSFSISSTSDLSTAQRLVDTYLVILKTRTMLNDVIAENNLPYSYEQLCNMISATSVDGTEAFRITVTCGNPTEAEQIANAVAAVLPEKIGSVMTGSDVRIVDYAVIPSYSNGPNYTGNTMKGALAGAALAALIIIVIFILDDKIRSEDILTQSYPDIPLLAVVPLLGEHSSHHGSYYASAKTQTSATTESAPKSKKNKASAPAAQEQEEIRFRPAPTAVDRAGRGKKPAGKGKEAGK